MTDYLINVLVAGKSWFLAAFVLAITLVWILSRIKETESKRIQKIRQELRNILNYGPGLLVFIGLLVGLTSPSNTPKLTTDYDKSADLRNLRELDQMSTTTPVMDISRQPATVEDRAASSIDMRERVSQ